MIRNQLGAPVKIVKLHSQNRIEVELIGTAAKIIRHVSEIREDTPGELKKALMEHDETKTLFNLTEDARAVRAPDAAATGAQATK